MVADWIDAAQGGGLLAATDDVYRTLSLTRDGARRHGGARAARRADAAAAAAAEGEEKSRRPRSCSPPPRAAPPTPPTSTRCGSGGGRRPRGAPCRRTSFSTTGPSRRSPPRARRPSIALSEIPGIGPAKLEAYGKDLLALLGGSG